MTKARGDELESALGTYSELDELLKEVNGKAVGGGEAEEGAKGTAPTGGPAGGAATG